MSPNSRRNVQVYSRFIRRKKEITRHDNSTCVYLKLVARLFLVLFFFKKKKLFLMLFSRFVLAGHDFTAAVFPPSRMIP